MLKKAVLLVATSMSLMSAQSVMAKDVRPTAVSFKSAVAKPGVDVPAPARSRVAKRHDLFGLGLLPLVAIGAGVGLTVGLVALADNSSPS